MIEIFKMKLDAIIRKIFKIKSPSKESLNGIRPNYLNDKGNNEYKD